MQPRGRRAQELGPVWKTAAGWATFHTLQDGSLELQAGKEAVPTAPPGGRLVPDEAREKAGALTPHLFCEAGLVPSPGAAGLQQARPHRLGPLTLPPQHMGGDLVEGAAAGQESLLSSPGSALPALWAGLRRLAAQGAAL